MNARRSARAFVATALTFFAVAASGPLRAADAPNVTLSEGQRFVQTDGRSLYQAICQGCHMEGGRGAVGAGAYPALAANPRLASAAYPVVTLLQGRKGMPAFGRMLDDEQIAAVANYVRTHMDNDYPDAIPPAAVKALRGTP